MERWCVDKKIKVIIADDHALLREGIIKILSLEPKVEVVGEAEDGAQAVKLARSTDVDVMLMDINMPNLNGILATKIIKREKPEVNIIALTIHDQEEYLFEREVLQLMAQGLSNREIGEKLFISEKTVKNHVTNILQKLNVADRTQAALFAIKHRLVET